MKVENMAGKNDRPVPNQFVITDDQGTTYFQSYKTIVAKKQNGKVYLDRAKWDYSVTTSRWRNIFLRETTAKTKAKIKAGIYTLCDLN